MRNMLFVFLALLAACGESTSSKPVQTVVEDPIYRRDMAINVDGVIYDGVGVLPARDVYKIHVQAQGNLDLFTFETCHREEVTEKAWNVEGTERWLFFKRKIEKKREVKLEFRATPLEKDYCPIILGGYEEKGGRHSWAFLDVQTKEAKLAAELSCNGEFRPSYGVSVCQAKAGLVQSIKFLVPVKVNPSAECDLGKSEGDFFEFAISRGQCVYAFKSADGQIHRLTTIGYDQVKVRNQ